jgi:YkoY family integral membrane protein
MFLVFNATDVAVIGFLIFLEGILSLDNALVLALMVRGLPAEQRQKALTYGIWGAFLFRFISLFFLTTLMSLTWIKFVGGGYLIYIALRNLIAPKKEDEFGLLKWSSFWRVVLCVEIMDIAFSVDSILAAVSLTQNYWVVVTGGILGIMMMRFAAVVFIHLLRIFPNLERTAYLLVLTIGAKLVIQGFNIQGIDFHSSKSPASWLFWLTMMACISSGLRSGKRSSIPA